MRIRWREKCTPKWFEIKTSCKIWILAIRSDDRTYCSIIEYTCKTFLELLLSWYERTVLSEAPNEMMQPKRIATCTHSKPVPSEFLYLMRHQKSSSENSPMRKWQEGNPTRTHFKLQWWCFDTGLSKLSWTLKTRLQAHGFHDFNVQVRALFEPLAT